MRREREVARRRRHASASGARAQPPPQSHYPSQNDGFGPPLRGTAQALAPRPAPPGRTRRKSPPRGRRPPPRRPMRAARPPRRRWLRRLVLATLVLPVVLGGFAGVALFFFYFNSVPLSAEIGSSPTVILDSTGTVEFATLQPEFARTEVPIGELCPEGRRQVCDAVLAAEDAGFYEHAGVSVPGIVRAALRNVLKGEIAEGGSTISQQYIKTVTGDDERSGLRAGLRKVREAALAMKLEREYSKDEILGLYLNSIYFGRGAYGIQAAAQAYFGKDAVDLDVGQAAQLAGVIPAPSAYDPLDNPDAAERRYRYVLDRMLELGWLDPVEAGQLRAAPPQTQAREHITFNDAPFFVDIVRRELERELGEEIYTGLRVTTTLNLTVQGHAEDAYMAAFPEIDPTGALVAVDPSNGGIVALVGGENYQVDQFNLAAAPRQTGSTFKPFALAAWIDEGNSPESYFDAPAKIVLAEADDGDDWTVNNYEHAEYEPMSLRQATWSSVNTVYAQVQEQVGPRATAAIASRALGLEGEDALSPLASLVLGTAEISPLQLAEAYNTFASGGIHREAFAVVEARRGGEVVYRHPDTSERAMSEQVANGVTDVLRGVIAGGSGRGARIGRPAAGKTGTTQEYGDAWFAGYTPELTAVVWMGNRDNNQTMPGEPTGGDLPATVWANFMRATLDGVPVRDFPAPDWDDLIVVRESPEPSEDPSEEVVCDEQAANRKRDRITPGNPLNLPDLPGRSGAHSAETDAEVVCDEASEEVTEEASELDTELDDELGEQLGDEFPPGFPFEDDEGSGDELPSVPPDQDPGRPGRGTVGSPDPPDAG